MSATIEWFRHRPVLILAILFIICSSMIFMHLNDLNTRLIKSNTIQSARQYAEVLTKFRSLYTSEVIDKALKNGLVASHNYKEIANAVPLPATLSMLLGEQMGLEGLDVTTRLYSAYPFPWRLQSGGLQDQFGIDAWAFFQANKNQPFIRIETVNNIPSVRYAVADLMRDKCVTCHNAHPDTPKKGWMVGDVRGVLEVIQPLNQGLAGAKEISLRVVLLVSLMLIITLIIIYLFIYRLNKENEHSKQLNNLLIIEIKERKQAEEKAVLANQTKSLFLANISHEIRTPLNAILGYAQILKRDKSLKTMQHNALEIIENSGSHLLGLINDLLDIAKIESGVLELHPVSFDIGALMTSLSAMFHLKASQKKLHWKLYLDFPSDPLIVVGDEGKLRQILINLIGNSIKFTDQGYVQLKASIKADSVFIFTISDSGMGLSDDEISMLGKPFNQGHAGLTKGGTGLGLSISKRYLALMNSKLNIESTFGQGTSISFEITLPIDKEKLFSKKNNRNVKCLAENQHLNILIIDDNALNREVLIQLLNSIGAQTVQAENGNKGLIQVEQQKFDLIFTDIDMPTMDGYRFLQQTQQSLLNSCTPVIAISASTLEQQQSFFTDKGFAGYVGKPFLVNELFDCIQTVADVEFDYEDEHPHVDKGSFDPQQISWPDAQVMQKITMAAELCLISDIEVILNTLADDNDDNDDYGAFIAIVKEFTAHYDMDGLVEFLSDNYEK